MSSTTPNPPTAVSASIGPISTPKPASSGADKFLDAIQPFVIGGLSGMFATCIIQPIDMIKVSIQLKSEEQVDHKKKISPFAVAGELYKAEGIKGFYRGYLLIYLELIQHWLDRYFIPPLDWEYTKRSLNIQKNRISSLVEVNIQ